MSQFECRNLRPSRESVQTLKRLSGVNVFGAERFRIVWGWDVRDFTGKETILRYDLPERWLERFHLEYWVPPETYGSPEAWIYNGMDLSNGPYPHGGDYERVITFENAKTHEFMHPTPLLVTDAVSLFHGKPRPSDWQLKMAMDEKRDLKREAVRGKRNDIIDANMAAFGLSPWMAVSGPQTPTSRRTDWRNRL